MKNLYAPTFSLIFTLIFTLFSIPCSAQTIIFDSNQSLTISGPGFFPFSNTANDQFVNIFPSDPTLDVQISNFLGGPCGLAPAADFAEIGDPLIITGNGTFPLDFSMAGPGSMNFGLSFFPEGSNSCIFDLFIPTPGGSIISSSSTSSSSSSGIIITGGSGDDTINPNALTVFNTFLPDNLISTLSDSNNPQCQNGPSGINILTINGSGGDDIINNIFSTNLGLTNNSVIPRTFNGKAHTPGEGEIEQFTLFLPDNKKVAMAVHNQKLINTTDMTRIFLTAIFPSQAEQNTVMLGRNLVNSDIEVTLKEQPLPVATALAAVQHAIVSATMPWQLSNNGGFFITQGGGCVGPFCTIVESGMIVVVPGGACTPEKLNKRKSKYPTVNPSKFFDPFPTASKTIQIPSDNIVDPRHPLVAKVVRDRAYLIFQPVPAGAKIIQQVKLGIREEKD